MDKQSRWLELNGTDGKALVDLNQIAVIEETFIKPDYHVSIGLKNCDQGFIAKESYKDIQQLLTVPNNKPVLNSAMERNRTIREQNNG